ncbi:TauD/TfdA family dioxygenase [Kitasatospora sp. NPDC051853]|uniref:TauD/TfdA family dioxygenase n=1 Tax=Kitasatospora sp. NPDC051853 TaxID=3364058 RepID=UPI003794C685
MTIQLIGPTATTFGRLDLTDRDRDLLAEPLLALPDPSTDLDTSGAALLQAFAALPTQVLRSVLDFGRHPDTPGVMLITNLPTDPALPPTPTDGGPARDKTSHVAEGVLLGLSALLGEPIGFRTEKAGRAVHDVVPVSHGATTQTNQGSKVFLNYHNDIVYDASGRYDVSNPDFLVLHCLRQDPDGEAVTYYADARDILAALDEPTKDALRAPEFRLNAPGSYCRDVARREQVLSVPVPLVHGPCEAPEIAVSANGVHPLTPRAEAAFTRLQETCRDPRVSHAVHLAPGHALLVNNRKGLHARSVFTARHDGTDRWLQRSYVRRDTWSLRERSVPGARRVFD